MLTSYEEAYSPNIDQWSPVLHGVLILLIDTYVFHGVFLKSTYMLHRELCKGAYILLEVLISLSSALIIYKVFISLIGSYELFGMYLYCIYMCFVRGIHILKICSYAL